VECDACVCKEVFSSFPALQELEMPVNALRGVTVDAVHFLQLQVIVTHMHVNVMCSLLGMLF